MQLVVCLVVGLAASVEDLWRRRISNRTVVAGLIAGLLVQMHLHGWLRGSGEALAGALTGLAVFLVFFLAGGMGGGDIKLMAALGACLGVGQILRAALFTAIAGALVACGYLLWRRLRSGRPAGVQESIPYAPAIAVGAALSFLA